MRRRLHLRIEQGTGYLFGRYRVPPGFYSENPTYLVIGRPTESHAFSVVLGRQGFYLARDPDSPGLMLRVVDRGLRLYLRLWDRGWSRVDRRITEFANLTHERALKDE